MVLPWLDPELWETVFVYTYSITRQSGTFVKTMFRVLEEQVAVLCAKNEPRYFICSLQNG
jgi:hypothetical protein